MLDLDSPIHGTVVEFGCGRHNPLGLSVLLFLNGADATIATDLDPCLDDARAALAIYDLLVACLTSPDRFKLPGVQKAAFRERIERFDLERLRDGDLGGGLGNAPCRYVVGSFKSALETTELSPVDLVVSFSVLEHVDDLPAIVDDFFTGIASGGRMVHTIDFIDHRAYGSEISPWGYLLEGSPRQEISNELRYSEVMGIVEARGFKTLSTYLGDEEPGPEVWSQLRERFRHLPRRDITTQAAIVVFERLAE